MTERLVGQIALVTGGGQGIGRGVALALAKEGARVAIAGRTVSKCVAVADEVTATGGQAIALECNVSDRAQIVKAVESTATEFDGLSILVNNAQSTSGGLLEELSAEDIALNWQTGALASFHAMQAALPYLKEAGSSSIVNFGSSTAIDGAAGFGAYAMSKEAIRGLSRVAAREWGKYGIRVNVVVPNALSPSAIEFRESQPERFARMSRGIPLGRVGDPEDDIGRAVVSLVSPDLDYMTGQTLMLTGGA